LPVKNKRIRRWNFEPRFNLPQLTKVAAINPTEKLGVRGGHTWKGCKIWKGYAVPQSYNRVVRDTVKKSAALSSLV